MADPLETIEKIYKDMAILPKNQDENNEVDEVNEEDLSPEEFSALNNQLDGLNNALDFIEEKNDEIHARLLELLKTNKEYRESIVKSKNETGESSCEISSEENSKQKGNVEVDNIKEIQNEN